jgi:uncharacterized Zn finger protein (UPF0148 family)
MTRGLFHWLRRSGHRGTEGAPQKVSQPEAQAIRAAADAAHCPYCGVALAKRPRRNTECPACGQSIHVKRRPHQEGKRLVTEAQAEEIEAEWRARRRARWLVEQMSALGVSAHECKATLEDIAPDCPPEDLHWGAAWILAAKVASETTDLPQREMAFWTLASLADKEGLDFSPYLARAHETELLAWTECPIGLIRFEIFLQPSGFGRACPTCRAAVGRLLTLQEALAEQPLPPPGCTCTRLSKRPGFSWCEYRPVFEWEMEDDGGDLRGRRSGVPR